MGDEEERRELSEGLKEVELLSPCSTDRELGLSSKACTTDRGTLGFSQHSLRDIYGKRQMDVQPIKRLITETVKSSEVVVRKTNWLRDIVHLFMKTVVYSCSSVYHLAFDELLDGDHQLCSTGRL